jgi:hypothetical protein
MISSFVSWAIDIKLHSNRVADASPQTVLTPVSSDALAQAEMMALVVAPSSLSRILTPETKAASALKGLKTVSLRSAAVNST